MKLSLPLLCLTILILSLSSTFAQPGHKGKGSNTGTRPQGQNFNETQLNATDFNGTRPEGPGKNGTHPHGPASPLGNNTILVNDTTAVNQTILTQRNGPGNNRYGSESSNNEGVRNDDREKSGFFGTFIKTLLILGTFGFIASVVYYRYQLKKYRMVPFVPPSFCPKAIFPPINDVHQGTGYNYGDLDGENNNNNYRAPDQRALIEC